MKKITLYSIVLALLFVLLPMDLSASEGHDKKSQPEKTGILLVAFGSSEKSAWVSFETIEKAVKAAYPDIPVRWAYTSHIIRKKLAKQGKLIDSPATALAKMMDDNFTHVVVQSLHTIQGEEYNDLIRTVDSFKGMRKFRRIAVGAPLLSTQKDMKQAVDAVMKGETLEEYAHTHDELMHALNFWGKVRF